MRVIRGSAEILSPPERAVVTIGNFDGLHLGHRAILRTVTDRARDLDGISVVFTFEPHPRKVIGGRSAPSLLLTLDQKIEVLGEAGIDWLVVETFDTEFAKTSPETFVRDILKARLAPAEVYVGYDFHYGRDREGSMRLLTELGPTLGFSVTVIPEVRVAGRDVSSTRIREALHHGDVAVVKEMMGRPFSIRGRVVKGDQRGRQLGFPTINLDSENELLPGHGVYATRVRFLDDGDPSAGAIFDAVTNVGRRPTFKDDDPPLAETHLLDFAGDLYGRRFELSFEIRLRAEERFPGPEALQAQIQRDIAAGREGLRTLSRSSEGP